MLRYLPRPQDASSHMGSDIGNNLSLEMRTYRRSEAPRYLALTYVWGAQGSERAIALNEQRLSARVNVYAALNNVHSHMNVINSRPEHTGLKDEDWLYSGRATLCGYEVTTEEAQDRSLEGWTARSSGDDTAPRFRAQGLQPSRANDQSHASHVDHVPPPLPPPSLSTLWLLGVSSTQVLTPPGAHEIYAVPSRTLTHTDATSLSIWEVRIYGSTLSVSITPMCRKGTIR